MAIVKAKRRGPIKNSFAISFLLFLAFTAQAISHDQPAWLKQAKEDAKKDGYSLITASELKTMYDSGKAFAIVDIRPLYEYREGHLPNARYLELDLGDRLELKPEKERILKNLLGPDKQRVIVFYCRNFA